VVRALIKKVFISVHGVSSLRRYLVVNGISTAALYLAIWTFLPHLGAVSNDVNQAWDGYVTGNALLAPMFNRVIVVAAYIAGLN
jgi:hypothetical protein